MAAIRQFCWWRIFLEGRGKVRDKKKIKRSVRWKSLGELGVGGENTDNGNMYSPQICIVGSDNHTGLGRV